MRILLVGGGSGGPVAPLLAVAQEIKNIRSEACFLFVGGKSGPEKAMAEHDGLPFVSIHSGKLRRYFSWKNIFAPLGVVAGFFESLNILRKFKPDCIFGAGSFVQVPLVWAAWVAKIPIVLHQQDVQPSLANKLCSLLATNITVTFESSILDYSSGFGLFDKKHENRVVLTGNPFRKNLKNIVREDALAAFGLHKELPVLFVTGGGTGAQGINSIVGSSLPELTKTVQIIHQTGNNKSQKLSASNYHPYEFISNMGSAYAAADLVLSRAGVSTATELSNLGKISIIIPMPHSHQELNAWYFDQKNAAIVMHQEDVTPEVLVKVVRKLLFDHQLAEDLKKNIAALMPKNSAEKISGIIVSIIERK